MSKDIIIEQTGTEQALSGVEKIQTQPASDDETAGVISWVPEDEVQLEDTLEITENGTYTASDEGVYGWKKVVVNVPMSVLSGSHTPEATVEDPDPDVFFWEVQTTADNNPVFFFD